MTDYSQWGEQAAILKACGCVDDKNAYDLSYSEGASTFKPPLGAFLDIGCFNAKALSNTRALYELGWGGVVVEPSPGPVKGLIQDYGNDDRIKVVSAAIGSDRHMVKFHITDDAVTTSDDRNFHKWQKTGGFLGNLWVPMVTLAEILHQFGSFDFVNIDTEGTSIDIFRQLMDTEMLPRCVCCEHDGYIVEITQRATERGYNVVLVTGDNVVLSR